MKKLLLLALLAMIMVGCKDKSYESYNTDGYSITIIDSCEYIINSNAYGDVVVHKGNCKFCMERNKKMMKEQVDAALLEIFD